MNFTHKFLNICFIITVILVMPIIFIGILKLYYIIIPGEEIGNISDWIVFSGSYIGIITAAFGIWYQVQVNKKYEIDKENKKKKENLISLFHLFIDASDNYSKFLTLFIEEETINKSICIFPSKNIMEQLILEADSDFKDILIRGYSRFFAIELYNNLKIDKLNLISKLEDDKKIFDMINCTLKKILNTIKKEEYNNYSKFKTYVSSELEILDANCYKIDKIKRS